MLQAILLAAPAFTGAQGLESNATGAPEISGVPQVGRTLTAGRGTIADTDGLPATFPDDYTLQWVRVDGATAADIPEATTATYTPVAADVGKTLEVRVGFTDGGGGAEGPLDSEETAAVVAAQEDCDGDRPDADWCAAMSVGTWRLGGLVSAYGSRNAYGSIDRRTIAHGRDSYSVTGVWIVDAVDEIGATDHAEMTAKFDAWLPRGTVFDFGARTFTAHQGSELPGTPGSYYWVISSGKDWHVGQNVTVSANLPPGVVSAGVGGTSLVLTYTEALDEGSVPAPSAYSVAVDGGAGATPSGVAVSGSAVTLTLADAVRTGRTVTVSYTVPASNPLRDTSGIAAHAMSDTPVEHTGLTASFENVPVEHDGSGVFTMELVFSEEPAGLSYRTVRDDLFTVTGGTIKRAQRTTRNSNLRFRLKVRPSSSDAVSLALAIPLPACGESGAVCTREGRTLSGAVVATIPGPLALSVADATAAEGANAELSFEVSLSRAASGTVTVDYATADDSATAGEDYTSTNGTLSFTAGETEKTVSVTVLDDAHDEGHETLTLTLSNPSGAHLADSTATGTIRNSDVMPQAWLARFGRTVADQVLDAVESRISASRTAGSEFRIAHQAFGGATPTDWLRGAARTQATERAGLEPREVTGHQLLTGSSFSWTGGTSDSGLDALWGRGASSRLSGREGALTLDGEVASAMMGADLTHGRGAAGLVLGFSRGEGSYRSPTGDGEVESTLTGLYPWGSYALNERLTVWGAAGYGKGTLTLAPAGAATIETDMDLQLASVGVRSLVMKAPAEGGAEIAVTSDAMFVRTTSDRASVGSLVATDAESTRLRLGLEGSHASRFEGGATLTPSVELGLRHDGGDAETGFGADIGAGLAWRAPQAGLSAEIRGRGLLTHAEKSFRDRGFSGMLGWDPAPSSKIGPSLAISHSVGASASGGLDALFRSETYGVPGADDGGRDESELRSLETKADYGFALFGGGWTGTPELRLGWSEDTRETVLGWRLTEARRAGLAFGLGVEGARRDSVQGDAEPVHRAGVGFGWRLEDDRRERFEFRFEGSWADATGDDTPEHQLGAKLTAQW